MSHSANHHRRPRSSTTERGAAIDELFDVLRDSRRRAALSVLADRRDAMDVGSLARAVAHEERDDPDEDAVRDVHVRLHHVHLPKLDEAGLVEYDREAATVTAPDGAFEGVPIDIE